MSRKEFFEKLLKERGESQDEAAKAIGISQAGLSKFMNGNGKSRFIYEIASHFGLTPQECLDGRRNERDVDTPSHTEKHEFDKKYRLIPRYDVSVSTGAGHENGTHVEISNSHAFRIDWLKKNGWDPEHLCIVEASGNSMEPRIAHGDVLLINMSDKIIQSGEIYALAFPSDGVRAKRLFWMADGRLRISSDNPDKSRYPDEFYSQEEASHLTIIGKIVHRAGAI